MVDCVDHISLRLTEWLLRPLERLREQEAPATATLRPPGRGRRVLIHVTKLRPDGPGTAPRYRWSSSEAPDGEGDPHPDPALGDHELYDDPVDAYWAAVDAVADDRLERRAAKSR